MTPWSSCGGTCRPRRRTFPVSASEAPRVLIAGGETWPYSLARRPRQRRLWVRVAVGGAIRVSAPRRCGDAEIESFLREHLPWIRRQRERRRLLADSLAGSILYQGRRRPVELVRGARFSVEPREDALRVALPPGKGLVPMLERWFRRAAAESLPLRTREFAALHGVAAGRVTIRGQKTLWGSCTRANDINLNWRLLMAPPEAADYVILHELAHVRWRGHGPRFWAHLADLCPSFEVSRRWLKENGPSMTLSHLEGLETETAPPPPVPSPIEGEGSLNLA